MEKKKSKRPTGRQTSKRTPQQPNTVEIVQGAAQNVTAKTVSVRQGAMLSAHAEQIELFQGGVGLVQANEAKMVTSQSAVVIAEGPVSMEQSGAGVIAGKGSMRMKQSGALAVISNDVTAEESGVVFLFARTVRGTIRPMFGAREAAILGVAAGALTGLVLSIGKLFRK